MPRVCGDTVDGPGDRDTALPHRDGDYRCYCWPPATEIAVLPGNRLDGQVNGKFRLSIESPLRAAQVKRSARLTDRTEEVVMAGSFVPQDPTATKIGLWRLR